MRAVSLVILLCFSLSATAQLQDSVVSRYRRLGYFLSTSRAEPPFRVNKIEEDGSLTVSDKLPSIYYLNLQGHPLPGSPFGNASQDFNLQGYALVERNNHVGMIDRRGHQVLPFHYEELAPIHHPRQWLAARQNGDWGLIDTTGRVMVPLVYDEIRPFSNGMAAVEKAAKWGFIDEDGKEVIRPVYAFVWQDFSEGFSAVSQSNNHSLGFINKHNQPITAFTYDYPMCLNRRNAHIQDATLYYQFRHGFALVRNARCEVGVLNTKGQEVLPVRFYSVEFTDSTIVGYRGRQRQVYRLSH